MALIVADIVTAVVIAAVVVTGMNGVCVNSSYNYGNDRNRIKSGT